jgi:hypothetical protein
MTQEEAREYLNLPTNSRKQLIRKRYLELKKDYLKAIYNAPSDHFSTLYRENLEKIEEAYQFLIEPTDGVKEHDSRVQHSIKQIQLMVNTFLRERRVLDSESRQTLMSYMTQIDRLKNTLKQGNMEVQLQVENPNQPGWHRQVEEFESVNNFTEPESSSPPIPNQKSSFLQQLVELVVGVPVAQSTGARRYLYDRLLMVTIIAIVVLGVLGTLYVMFPLFF